MFDREEGTTFGSSYRLGGSKNRGFEKSGFHCMFNPNLHMRRSLHHDGHNQLSTNNDTLVAYCDR